MLQNIHRIEGDVTYISLTRGKDAIISTIDLERVLQTRWYAELVQHTGDCYARGKPRGEGKSILLHRYIMGAKKDEWVDHINFNTLDNRRENLRLVTPSENRIHQRRKPGETGLLYIHLIKNPSGYQQYFVSMMREGVRKSKSFPYTAEGLQSAKDLVEKWKEDFSYEPERSISRRHRRENFNIVTSSEEGPHVNHKIPEVDQSRSTINGEGTAYVAISKGKEVIVDKNDLEKVRKYRWYATPNSMGSYYAMAKEGNKTIYMHRYLIDAPEGMFVDHINHNTLDNRRTNLRVVTHQENDTNRNGAYNTSKTGIRGVSVHKCKPSGFMYIFRCHCVTCKETKYFPFTKEGLEAARVFAEAHYAAIKGSGEM